MPLGPNDRGSVKPLAFQCHFPSYSRFLFCEEIFSTKQSWRQRLVVISFLIRHISYTLLKLPHKMSQLEHWNCAMCVFHYCSVNIKVPAQGSSRKFKERLSRNQIESPAVNLVEALRQKLSAARLT